MGFPNSREDRWQEEQPCDTAPMETRAEPPGHTSATALQQPQLWKTIKLQLKEHQIHS